jgi:hypothetical protein
MDARKGILPQHADVVERRAMSWLYLALLDAAVHAVGCPAAQRSVVARGQMTIRK